MQQVRLGYPDRALHEAAAAAVARVLEAHELEVAYVPVPPDRPYGAEDDIELFCCAWLPLIDARLLSGGMRPIGLLYRPAFIWCVGAAAAPAGIADLAGCAALERRILVPRAGPAAALAEAAQKAYRLAEGGFEVLPVSDAEALASAEQGARDADRVVPLFRPHELLHGSSLRVLADPLAALGGEQEARLLISDDLRRRLDPDLLDELDELTLGNKVRWRMRCRAG